jgi:dihydrofolate synthase / folylpolyglutamate synthase
MKPSASLEDWLANLYKINPLIIDLSLTRLQQVLLSYPVHMFTARVITVAGTNGKGSTVAFLDQILRNSGYRVACFTSPHVLHFNERIQINGQAVSDKQLFSAFAAVEAARGEVKLTFFEFVLLAALTLFQAEELDFILLEVGVGGRLDAVNCVDADIGVITSIDFDHQHWLGHTRDEIAENKAGIMRSHKPLVCGEPAPPAVLYKLAEQLSVPFYLCGRDYHYQVDATQWRFQHQTTCWDRLPLPKLPIQNAATVMQVITLLQREFEISDVAVNTGIREARLLGRMQRLPLGVPGVMDVAHNAQSIAYLASYLQLQPCAGKTHAIFSILKDKDRRAALQPMLAMVDHWNVAVVATPRGCSLDDMVETLTALQVERIHVHTSIAEAFQAVSMRLGAADRVVVFGSFHVVTELLEASLELS